MSAAASVLAGPIDAAQAAGCVPERQVMDQVGLHQRGDIRAWRDEHLVEGVDWLRTGNRVMWTAAAQVRCLAEFSGKTPPGATSEESAPLKVEVLESQDGAVPITLVPEIPDVEVLRVTGCGFRNRRIIHVHVEEGWNLAAQRKAGMVMMVKDGGLFVAGMKVLGRRTGTGCAWTFAGNPARPVVWARYPRTRGVW